MYIISVFVLAEDQVPATLNYGASTSGSELLFIKGTEDKVKTARGHFVIINEYSNRISMTCQLLLGSSELVLLLFDIILRFYKSMAVGHRRRGPSKEP
jgi:hypothetical protein